MHTRERGAAHINIFYFLVMLVLFLGAVGFGYVQLTENTELRESIKTVTARNAQLEHDLLVYDHYAQDITKVVGEPGTYAGRPGHNYELAEGVTQKSLDGVSVPAKVESLLVDFAREVGVPESTAKPVNSLLSQSKETLGTKDKRISDVQAQNATLSTQLTTLQANVATANQQKASEVSQLAEAENELRQFITTQLGVKDQTIASLRDEVRSRADELEAERNARAAERAELRKQNSLLSGQISGLAAKLALVNPPQEPDGKVISASAAAGKAWIDLGRMDMLPRGTVFEITEPRSGKVKGYGRVTRLEQERAELSLFDVADPFDPIVKGDLIRNDLYGKNVRRDIYLLGRFPLPDTKENVKLVLEQLGNRVHDKIGPGVDLVIVGSDTLNEEGDGFTPVTETEDYKQALFLNIEIAHLNKIRDFLRLSSSE